MRYYYTMLQQLALLILLLFPACVQSCMSNDECQNGGVCESSWIAAADQANSVPVCNCLPGYWGYDCRDTCDINCENRGQCHFGTSGDHGGGDVASGEVICKCPPGFSGPTCGIREIEGDAADSGATDNESSGNDSPSYIDPTATSAEDSTSRSAGAKFGIALSVFLILGLVGAVVLRKRRHSSKNATTDPSSSSTTTESVQEREFA